MYKVVRQGFLDSSEKGFEGQIRDFQLYKGNKGINRQKNSLPKSMQTQKSILCPSNPR